MVYVVFWVNDGYGYVMQGILQRQGYPKPIRERSEKLLNGKLTGALRDADTYSYNGPL